jgi:small subunit ribosomal protein S16
MTKIRLARTGSKFQPSYRVVVTDSRNRRDGRFIESLGYYNPMTSPATVQINQERATYWVGVGAQASNTVISLLTKSGVTHPYQVRKKPVKPKEPTAAAPAEAATTAEETAEAPAAEAETEDTPVTDEATATDKSESAEPEAA